MSDEKEERRLQWIAILKECAMYHNEIVENLKSPIIGAEETEDSLMHKGWCLAIMDAIGLIEVLPLIDEENERKGGLPQDSPGPAG